MDRWSIRHAGLAAIALTALLLGVLFALPTSAAPPALSGADIVVQFPNGLTTTRRITFTGTISGYAALLKSGLPLVTSNSSFGPAICRIGDTGCANGQSCFCECASGTDCRYWQYSQFGPAGFVSSQLGASSTSVADGAIEGWSWGRSLPAVGRASYAARAGVQWLEQSRRPDGSYGGVGSTIDAALAEAAVGQQPDAALVAFLRANAASYAKIGASQAGKLMLGVAAAGLDPRNFGGLDLVVSTTATLNSASGAYGSSNWDQAFAILGLRAAAEPVPANALAALRGRAASDGGFGYQVELGGNGDVDSTGLVLQALVAGGEPITSTVVTNALAFLDAAQHTDGGFAYAGDPSSNANSTALAIQGILAAGSDPLAARWRPASTNPISYLLTQQQPAGAFVYANTASALATAQAVPALSGQPFPPRSPAVALRRALDYIAGQQRSGGGFADFGGAAPTPGGTVEALLAIRAAGARPASVTVGGKSGLDYLRTNATGFVNNPAAVGKLMLGVAAAGGDARAFGGYNLVISTTQRYNPVSGAYGTTLYDQAYSMLGLAAVGEPVPISATKRLEQLAVTGGGWDGFGFGVNPDDTGLALLAWAAGQRPGAVSLAAVCVQSSEPSSRAVRDGIAYLLRSQNGEAGWGDGATSTGSTGLALQGLIAVGQQTASLGWTRLVTDSASISRITEQRPLARLLARQQASGGLTGYGGGADPRETYQGLPGISGQVPPFRSSYRTWLTEVRR